MIQVTLEINAENLAPTIEQVFSSLTPEDRKELATKVLMKYIEDPYLPELHITKREFAAKKRTERASDGWNENRKEAVNMTDDEIVQQWRYDFNTFTNSRKSSKQIMIEGVLAAAVETFKERTKALVENNEELKVIFNQVSDQMKANFPGLVHDIMMMWFTSQLSASMRIATDALQQSKMNSDFLQTVRNQLHG